MKFTKLFLLFLSFPLFYCGSCNDKVQQSFWVVNNSDQDIVLSYSSFDHFFGDNICAPKKGVRIERVFFDTYVARANSVKNFSNIAGFVTHYPSDTIWIYIYLLDDVDNMSCEEFNAKDPYKKRFVIAKADVEAMKWTITYP